MRVWPATTSGGIPRFVIYCKPKPTSLASGSLDGLVGRLPPASDQQGLVFDTQEQAKRARVSLKDMGFNVTLPVMKTLPPELSEGK